MDKNKIPWVAGLLALGLTALVVSFFIDSRSRFERESIYQIGQVEKLKGKVWIFRPGIDRKTQVEKSLPLSPLDSVEVEDGAEARILFENTALVHLNSESLVTFERNDIEDGAQDVIFIQRGDLKIEDPGRDGELFISKNGQRLAAKIYNESKLSQEPVNHPKSVEPSTTESSSGLSDDEISTLVTAQRSNFMKCYMTLLQREPQSKGDVSMNFTIENSGKVGLIEISSVSLKQDDFKKCLTQVLSRIQFRAFSGTPISTFFPLKFE